jgi:transmembrane sensor
MNSNLSKLEELIRKAHLSTDEKEWFLNYLEQENSDELRKLMENEFENSLENDEIVIDDLRLRNILDILHGRIEQPVSRGNLRVMFWKRIAVAASIIAVMSAGAFWAFHGKKRNLYVKTKTTGEQHFTNDVLPPARKAILTLSNGSQVTLGSRNQNGIPNQGNAVVKIVNGSLVYKNSRPGPNNLVAYNNVSTPKGGRLQVQLPDGTKIWLNSASSIRFPTSFQGKDRLIEFTGEGYFEVAKNKAMPFIVKMNQSEVKVLGTHFNIMSYADEPMVKTTLLEGSVAFKTASGSVMLKPGQQSQLDKTGKVVVASGIDTDDAIAWKNGLFHFENENIESIMRELSRSYDVDIVYNKKTDELFYGEIPNTAKLSEVLKLLELTGKVRFDIIGKKVIVNP